MAKAYQNEMEALVALAMQDFLSGRIDRSRPYEAYTELALRRFRKECPDRRSQKAYVEAFIRHSDRLLMARLSTDDKARAALKFWFEVVWPHLVDLRRKPEYQAFIELKRLA